MLDIFKTDIINISQDSKDKLIKFFHRYQLLKDSDLNEDSDLNSLFFSNIINLSVALYSLNTSNKEKDKEQLLKLYELLQIDQFNKDLEENIAKFLTDFKQNRENISEVRENISEVRENISEVNEEDIQKIQEKCKKIKFYLDQILWFEKSVLPSPETMSVVQITAKMELIQLKKDAESLIINFFAGHLNLNFEKKKNLFGNISVGKNNPSVFYEYQSYFFDCSKISLENIDQKRIFCEKDLSTQEFFQLADKINYFYTMLDIDNYITAVETNYEDLITRLPSIKEEEEEEGKKKEIIDQKNNEKANNKKAKATTTRKEEDNTLQKHIIAFVGIVILCLGLGLGAYMYIKNPKKPSLNHIKDDNLNNINNEFIDDYLNEYK